MDHARLQRLWYDKYDPLSVAMAPLGWLYGLGMRLRGLAYRLGILRSHRVNAVVIVVGNVMVGGTGKTPLVIALAGYLAQRGWRPGIVCRGYGGNAQHWPQPVTIDSDPERVGDEAVLMAKRANCPVIACGSKRVQASRELIARQGCNIIVSDDGLQHLALRRDVEIVVFDGERRHGNGRCLPAGPLREPLSRLARVNLVVVTTMGDSPTGAADGELQMRLVGGDAVSLLDSERRVPLREFSTLPVHAVAGIGHPQRFFTMLEAAGLQPIGHVFADHHEFVVGDVEFGDELAVLMTEKDAVKCGGFARQQHWYVPVAAHLSDEFFTRLTQLLPAPTENAGDDVGKEVVA